MKPLADCLIRPTAVAIVGASGDLAKNNSRPQRYLRKHGYTGAIYPINPGRQELFGERCYPTLAAVGQPIDHAFVMVGTNLVEAVIEDCAAAGVRVATIFSGGFAEAGPEGQALQARLRDVARAGGVRLVGPNSMGLINTQAPCTLSANAVLDRDVLPKGRVGLVSQSGSLTGALISRGQGRNIAFSTLVSIGNEIDVAVGEVAEMLVDDPDTDVVLLFLETLRNPETVAQAARHAAAVGKPMMAYVLGRSELGRELAQSHTGAMMGGGRAIESFLDDLGVMRLDLFEGLLEAPMLVKGRKPATGRRVAVITTTGGGAAMVADHLGDRGIEVVRPTRELKEALAAEGIAIGDAPVVDLTMAGTRESVVDACMRTFTANPGIDAIVTVVGSSAEYRPEMAVAPLVKWARGEKPIVAFLFPQAERSLALLAEAGIAGFRTPEACADAIDAYLSWTPPRPRPTESLAAEADTRLGAAATAGVGSLSERDALGVFAALGVPVPAMSVIGADGTVPEGLAYPVVAKVLSADIAHKTDAGGVVLGIPDAAALAAAAERIRASVARHAPAARIDGVLVQPMEKGMAEAIVGFKRDPLAGPMVMVGLGGTLAEIYEDFALRPAPVDETEARRMIDEVKGLALIRGYRGAPRGDIAALARVVAAVSRLALSRAAEVSEAEINPVLVKAEGQGVVAVDGLIALKPSSA
ncbi:MAG: acetate--CoA ligase family protein [Hyphomicrobiaceae bacterium]